MTLDEKLITIANTLDAERKCIEPSVLLETLDEWDSMGVISIIAMLDKKFSKVLNVEQIESLKTINDIVNLMEN